MRTLRTCLCIVGLFALCILAPASQAAAAGPTHVITPVDFTFVRDDFTAACGFTVTEHASGRISDLVFTDAAGNVTHILESYQLRADFEANGKTLRDQVSGPERLVFHPDGSFTIYTFGTYDFTVVPGGGVVAGSAGRTVAEVSPTGQLVSFTYLSGRVGNNTAAFCAALAP
ncbi:MAG TPA: hypothetical protein VFM49_27830 [Chloroflexia bacterium]|jgi:hypothetical protein|nr:hypothetical protein [Chloroflexia bacterium]